MDTGVGDLEAFTCFFYGARSRKGHQQAEVYNVIDTLHTTEPATLQWQWHISQLSSLLKKSNVQGEKDSPCRCISPDVTYPELQKPYQSLGWDVQGARLEYKWTQEETLPKALTDLVLDQDEGDQDEDDEDDEDLDTEEYNIQEDVIDDEEVERRRM